jgi:hypothetical protein
MCLDTFASQIQNILYFETEGVVNKTYRNDDKEKQGNRARVLQLNYSQMNLMKASACVMGD